MPRKRLVWQIFPPFLLIILVALVSVSWLFTQTLDSFHREEMRRGLEAQGRLMVNQLRDPLLSGDIAALDRMSTQLSQQSSARVTIVLPDGFVVGDSEETPQQMENHATRPEILKALGGEVGESTRYSSTLQQQMMYVALPVVQQDRVIGCVRTALPIASIARTLHGGLYQIINSLVLIAIAAALVSLWLSRRLSRPLEEMKRGAQRFAKGELEKKLPTFKGEELGALAEAMNQMAQQLDDRIRSEVRQRNQQDAVLASMIEGVIAIDQQEKILRINQAAATLLALDAQTITGQKAPQVILKPELQKFIRKALESDSRIEEDMTLRQQDEERFLQVHGAPLCGSDGQKIGALIAINDITRLRHLESLRRDFVANVSHELKTPITAIKGAVETLLGGANEDPQNSQRFLEIASRQTDRLNAIIDDLLALSRLERDAEATGIERSRQDLRPILTSALQSCASSAESKSVQLNLFCSEGLIAQVNGALLEQAVINLVDNAIKYSDVETVVTIEGWQDAEQINIKVQDRGQGIPQEHLNRLFERFYRVDTARSRAIGGTGLGLAIVKHIVQAHNGDVTVHSTPGQGCVFMISLQV
ncbi:MAG: ATP-binding protein [Desulfuromonadales bacterium]|nr:ATP-binding protein [Desulfuromonadales bacterium]